MSWLNRKGNKTTPQEFEVPRPRFLREQDGPPERELKRRLSELFEKDQISSAYLAQVAYNENSYAIALCLRSESGPNGPLVQEVGHIFASMFGAHEHLDIIFISKSQEAELRTVCKPFFSLHESI